MSKGLTGLTQFKLMGFLEIHKLTYVFTILIYFIHYYELICLLGWTNGQKAECLVLKTNFM